jgi:protein-L-isoaspartate O-methyltransferase
MQVIAERHLNNGQPSGHAIWITSATIKAGEHVVHIGTGTGYYTAIMACLVGPSGKVTGIELDASLAARAKENLSSYPNVRIVNGDGTSVPFDAADAIYINAGVTRPVVSWLERLTDGGRLILPPDASLAARAKENLSSYPNVLIVNEVRSGCRQDSRCGSRPEGWPAAIGQEGEEGPGHAPRRAVLPTNRPQPRPLQEHGDGHCQARSNGVRSCPLRAAAGRVVQHN